MVYFHWKSRSFDGVTANPGGQDQAPALAVWSPPTATNLWTAFPAGLSVAASRAVRTRRSASPSFLNSCTCGVTTYIL